MVQALAYRPRTSRLMKNLSMLNRRNRWTYWNLLFRHDWTNPNQMNPIPMSPSLSYLHEMNFRQTNPIHQMCSIHRLAFCRRNSM